MSSQVSKPFDNVWVGFKPNGDVEAITFNPVETSSERAKYAELGWEWVRVVPACQAQH